MELVRGHGALLDDTLIPFDSGLLKEEALEVVQLALEETRRVVGTVDDRTVITRLLQEFGYEVI